MMLSETPRMFNQTQNVMQSRKINVFCLEINWHVEKWAAWYGGAGRSDELGDFPESYSRSRLVLFCFGFSWFILLFGSFISRLSKFPLGIADFGAFCVEVTMNLTAVPVNCNFEVNADLANWFRATGDVESFLQSFRAEIAALDRFEKAFAEVDEDVSCGIIAC